MHPIIISIDVFNDRLSLLINASYYQSRKRFVNYNNRKKLMVPFTDRSIRSLVCPFVQRYRRTHDSFTRTHYLFSNQPLSSLPLIIHPVFPSLFLRGNEKINHRDHRKKRNQKKEGWMESIVSKEFITS